VILATNPDIDGETTALYLAKALKPSASRSPGGQRAAFRRRPDYADEVTLAKSMETRREIT
jgi:recombination protein RecR